MEDSGTLVRCLLEVGLMPVPSVDTDIENLVQWGLAVEPIGVPVMNYLIILHKFPHCFDIKRSRWSSNTDSGRSILYSLHLTFFSILRFAAVLRILTILP